MPASRPESRKGVSRVHSVSPAAKCRCVPPGGAPRGWAARAQQVWSRFLPMRLDH